MKLTAYIIGAIGVIIWLVFSLNYTRQKARQACSDLLRRIAEDSDEFSLIAQKINRERKYEGEKFFEKASRVYLILKKGSSVAVVPLNDSKPQTLLDSQYNRLLRRLEARDFAYHYSFHGFSVFYRFRPPYEKNILRMDCDVNLNLNKFYRTK